MNFEVPSKNAKTVSETAEFDNFAEFDNSEIKVAELCNIVEFPRFTEKNNFGKASSNLILVTYECGNS